jgi:hypothetical protein
MDESVLSLDPKGDNYLLTHIDETGKKSEMILSDYDILKLAQSSRSLQGSILAKLNRTGVSAGVYMPVARVSLGTDIHVHEILLSMVDSNGAEQRFCLSLEVAKPLAERLPARVAQLEAAIPSQAKQ